MKNNKERFSSGAPWENKVGYSRAVKVGNLIEISGTTAMDGDKLVGRGNLYEQTFFILQKIERVLTDAGSGLNDVVRTRMYVTNIRNWEEAGRAHGHFFKDIKPATTMIEVSGLIDPELLIEIEVTAVMNSEK